MPVQIVRNDITKMRVDAIVNSTNPFLKPGGSGVDASIHAAAGPELRAALRRIGYCSPGSAVVTPAYEISQCKCIIHTAGPRFKDGKHGEKALLKECYRSVLQMAEEMRCESVAIPILSSGAYGYPRDKAYAIAAESVSGFLEKSESDMMVYLVLFSSEMMEAAGFTSGCVDACVDAYIDDDYCAASHEVFSCESSSDMRAFSETLPPSAPIRRTRKRSSVSPEQAPAPQHDPSDYAFQDLSFGEMCEWWMRKKDISKSQFYVHSNITKAAFWNLKNHPEQYIKKNTAFGCIMGLKLNLEEAEDLLKRAGLAFSPYIPTDRLVVQFIQSKNYDVFDLNIKLYDKDLSQII